MRVLAFDCAAGQCAATLLLDDGSVLSKVEIRERGHAERLVPMLMEIMAEAQMDFGNIDRIAVTTGPGSFTGVRVGLAAAAGLALARDIPVIGIDSFTAFAASLLHIAKTVIVIESRRTELYWRIMGDDLSPRCDMPDEIASIMPSDIQLIGGDAAGRLGPMRTGVVIQAQSPGPDIAALARLALTLSTPDSFPQPVYVRPPDAKLPGRGSS